MTGNETNEWDVRLVGGSYLWEGRVEIFLLGSWTTVYRYSSSHDARVVCQQLGYNTYGKCIGRVHACWLVTLCTLSSTSVYFCKDITANQHYHYKQVTIIISVGPNCCPSFGQGTGLIKIQYLRCNSLNNRVSECPYFSYSGYSHSNDFGVVCSIG